MTISCSFLSFVSFARASFGDSLLRSRLSFVTSWLSCECVRLSFIRKKSCASECARATTTTDAVECAVRIHIDEKIDHVKFAWVAFFHFSASSSSLSSSLQPIIESFSCFVCSFSVSFRVFFSRKRRWCMTQWTRLMIIGEFSIVRRRTNATVCAFAHVRSLTNNYNVSIQLFWFYGANGGKQQQQYEWIQNELNRSWSATNGFIIVDAH